jgi:hypothetical protein
MTDKAASDFENSQLIETGAPNIVLNTTAVAVSPQELRNIAIMAVILQSAVITFDGLVKYRYGWEKNNAQIAGYAFPLTVIGTVATSLGMFICAHLIEASTREITWEPINKNRNLQILWLQRGQTVNDQHFKSYGIYASSTQGVIRTSRPSPKRGELEGLTYVGVVVSVIGRLYSFA